MFPNTIVPNVQNEFTVYFYSHSKLHKMASANVSAKDSFLIQLDSVRADLRKKVARAHQVLQERETALLSKLQQLENRYRGDGVIEQIPELSSLIQQIVTSNQRNENKEILEQNVARLDDCMTQLKANLETARDRMRRVELVWDGNLEGKLSRIGSILVSGISDYKGKGKPIMVAGKQPASSYNTEGEQIHGLKNLGNTCFMNCVLQCLSHTLPLRQFYVSDEYLNNRKGDISHAFMNVMVELWDTTTYDSVDPFELKRQVGIVTPKFIGYKQHDAHEFMRFLLNELHEEINRASVEGRKSPADNETLKDACARYLTWEDSRISELFSGMLQSDVYCSVCSNQSTVYIPFKDIALPILERKRKYNYLPKFSSDPAIELSECLNMLITEETLDEEERPFCNKCMALTISTKQLSIVKLPRFLVIQLKRFSYYPEPRKILTHVKFDDIWRLALKSICNARTYFLYGIICHSGGIHGGHYIAYCKYRNSWRCFDDSMTHIVSWERVMEQEAYILFYEMED